MFRLIFLPVKQDCLCSLNLDCGLRSDNKSQCEPLIWWRNPDLKNGYFPRIVFLLCFLFRIGFGQDSSYVLLDCQTPIRSWCKFAKFFSNFDMSKKNYVQVFANPEDIKGTPNKVDFASEDVERVRRCHLVRIQILGWSKSKNQKMTISLSN